MSGHGESVIAQDAYMKYFDLRGRRSSEFETIRTLIGYVGADQYSCGYLDISGNDFQTRQADLAVVAPAGLMTEGVDAIVDFVGRVHKATERFPLTDVFLWCNSRRGLIRDVPLAEEEFERLVASLRNAGFDSNRLRIGVRHTSIDPQANLNEIRSSAMDSLTYLAFVRGWNANLPVVWLDIDTADIGEGALDEVHSAIISRQAHFVKTQLRFVDDRPDKLPLAQQTDADKVATIYSEARFLLEQCLEPQDTRGYVEECGLGFMLDTYMASGGIAHRRLRRGESKTLLLRASKALNTTSTPLLTYLDNALISTSDRRFRRLAQHRPAWELPMREQGPSYQEYSVMTDGEDLEETEVHRNVHLMIKYMVRRQERRTGKKVPESTLRAIGNLVTTTFPS